MKGVILFLIIITVILLGWNMQDFFHSSLKKNAVTLTQSDPVYQGQVIHTDVYNMEGFLSYTITAQDAQNYFYKKRAEAPDQPQNITWFTKPVMILFDKVPEPDWSLKSDRAKLVDDNMLYLYGHVELDSLVPTSGLKKITTETAEINLITQDVSSNDTVTVYGDHFSSSGMKMRGNLRNREADLLEKVKTDYEVQKENP